ncbi:interaptin-like [Leptopilina boulardi]|uniref:interaptin-like n=1 Tax=Leptopilina boulardi TaxID=63433 RepID=UPI0021F5F774|nr:interaptin-like [Leptopilina boulardi]
MLIKLINEKYSEIENYQQNQEELHKTYITNLESQFYQNTENLKQQIFQQLTKNETYGKSLFELISNLKTSTNDSLKKIENESINNLHILINNKHIDIRAELKIQYESFQNKCHSLDKEFSKKLNELENKFSDQLITINNLEKNQQTFNKQIVNLEEKLENIFEKFNEKLENNASLLTRLFDDKYKTLKNQQESIENSFFNNNNEMEKKFIQINEELKNNSQQIVDNDINQKTIITEQISNLNKVLSKIAENHQQKEKLSLEIINKLKIEISQINEDFQKLNKSENHLHNVLSRQRTEICSLEENQKLIEKNFEEKMKNNNQQFFETQENNLIIINKRIDDKCSKISKDCQEKEKFSIEKIRNFNVKILEIIENIEKLDKNKDQLHEAFFEQFMKIKTLENNFKLFSEENFNFKKSIENEMKKSNVTLKQ